MLDMILTLIPTASDIFSWFVEHANYWFVFIFMVIESSFIPFPSEIVVPPAAYIAATEGTMSVWGVGSAATLGALAGSLINYGLAIWIGRPIIISLLIAVSGLSV